MSTLHDIVKAAIGPLVGGRYYPTKFPQETGAPTWPAIRGTIVGRINDPSLCGAGDIDDDDLRLQLDICATNYEAAHALFVAANDAIEDMIPPLLVRQPGGFDTWDAEAKVHRFTTEWLYQPSSD